MKVDTDYVLAAGAPEKGKSVSDSFTPGGIPFYKLWKPHRRLPSRHGANWSSLEDFKRLFANPRAVFSSYKVQFAHSVHHHPFIHKLATIPAVNVTPLGETSTTRPVTKTPQVRVNHDSTCPQNTAQRIPASSGVNHATSLSAAQDAFAPAATAQQHGRSTSQSAS